MKLLDLLTNYTKLILIAALVIVVGLYGLKIMEVSQLESLLVSQSATIEKLTSQKDQITDAERSCKAAMDKLIQSAKKKHSIIKAYETKYHTGERDAIDNLDDFIDFARRMQ